MLSRAVLLSLSLLAGLVVAPTAAGQAYSEQAATIEKAEGVVSEIMAIPARKIPSELLAKSYGVAIIPNVIKIGFIAGVRRGHGVLLIKDKDGDWNLPQFITLTGGSIGWQVGAQATDVILVFKSAKSIDNIRNGKFTIGADAAAAAGPVGRNMAAATDAQMQAEILSYSRSRGLFAGVSLDGSAIEMNGQDGRDFYGDGSRVKAVPACAVKLMETIANLAGDGKLPLAPTGNANYFRKELAQSAQSLNAVLPPEWQRYLALPPAVYGQAEQPSVDALFACRQKFEKVNSDGAYAPLRGRPEFQTTLELLREYIAVLSMPVVVPLPPPPPSNG
jgi:SH3 domain-containing YSC84-like protein 1